MFSGWGNFGAPPNPPKRGSKELRRASRARSRGASSSTTSCSGASRQDLGECAGQPRILFADLLRMVLMVLGHAPQELLERGQAVTRHPGENKCRRKTAADRPGVRNMVSGQPPPRCVMSCWAQLIDLVEIGALLPIDLDVDEPAVHELRGRRILERLVRHHMAPMTGRIAHRQEDGLVFAPGQRERLLAPGIPVHRIVRVGEKIRAGFGGEAIAHRMRAILNSCDPPTPRPWPILKLPRTCPHCA